MSETLQYRFRVRRRTAADWTSTNEVLLESEMGRESDTLRFKFGDGVTAWNSLPYVVPTAVSAFTNDAGYLTAAAASAAYQPLDGDLTAIAALTGTGVLQRTGTNTWEVDTVLSELDIGTEIFFRTTGPFVTGANVSSGAANFGLGTTGAGSLFLFAGNTERFRVTTNGLEAKNGSSVGLASFTVAGVPSASTRGAGAMIYVSNESGGAVPAFSDGTNWRRVTDRAVIS